MVPEEIVQENELLIADAELLAPDEDNKFPDGAAEDRAAEDRAAEYCAAEDRAAEDRAEIDPVVLERLAELERETTEVLLKHVRSAFETAKTVLRCSLQLPVSLALGKRKYEEALVQ